VKNDVMSGTVVSVLYENDDFKILKLLLDESTLKTPVSVKGDFPAQSVRPGTWVSFEGKWGTHPQYGKQLTVLRSPVSVDNWTDDRVLAALSSNGVGPSVRAALKLLARKRTLPLKDLLDSGDLSTPRIDDISQMHALARWRSLRTYLDTASFLADAGVPAKVVGKVWSKFGTDLEALILTDPWVLVRVGGISFGEADSVAIKLGVPLSNPGRVRGAVLHAVRENVFEGHVFASTAQVVRRVGSVISNPAPQPNEIAEAIRDLRDQGSVVVDIDPVSGAKAIYDKWYWETEKKCAELLAEKSLQKPAPSVDGRLGLRDAFCSVGGSVEALSKKGASLEELAEEAVQLWSRGNKISLTPDQHRAVALALTSPVSLLTGLPGTGKTTALKAVVAISKDMGTPLLLAAPTGIAAKRMGSVTGSEAQTVHRAFGAQGKSKDDEEREATYLGITGESERKSSENEAETWGYGPGNPHPAELVVVDETSMLDLHMLYRLLTGTRPDSRLVLVGDPFQLPSVGAGDVLRGLVDSKLFKHSHLDKVFRQEETSGIVLAAHQVNAGKMPEVDNKDFILLEAHSESEASNLIDKVAQRLYGKRANFQVLSPRHGGEAGVTALNQRLRHSLNPSRTAHVEMRFGSAVVREGDRVMVVRNDYKLGVYNGDVGKVSRIDRRSKEVELKIFEGEGLPSKVIRYPFKNVSRMIRLAYAQTIHKSQGQEYDVIVVPVLNSFGRQLQRNLFYTAITRAKRKVFLVGSPSAIARAVSNNKADLRNSLLAAKVLAAVAGEVDSEGNC